MSPTQKNVGDFVGDIGPNNRRVLIDRLPTKIG